MKNFTYRESIIVSKDVLKNINEIDKKELDVDVSEMETTRYADIVNMVENKKRPKKNGNIYGEKKQKTKISNTKIIELDIKNLLRSFPYQENYKINNLLFFLKNKMKRKIEWDPQTLEIIINEIIIDNTSLVDIISYLYGIRNHFTTQRDTYGRHFKTGVLIGIPKGTYEFLNKLDTELQRNSEDIFDFDFGRIISLLEFESMTINTARYARSQAEERNTFGGETSGHKKRPITPHKKLLFENEEDTENDEDEDNEKISKTKNKNLIKSSIRNLKSTLEKVNNKTPGKTNDDDTTGNTSHVFHSATSTPIGDMFDESENSNDEDITTSPLENKSPSPLTIFQQLEENKNVDKTIEEMLEDNDEDTSSYTRVHSRKKRKNRGIAAEKYSPSESSTISKKKNNKKKK